MNEPKRLRKIKLEPLPCTRRVYRELKKSKFEYCESYAKADEEVATAYKNHTISTEIG